MWMSSIRVALAATIERLVESKDERAPEVRRRQLLLGFSLSVLSITGIFVLAALGFLLGDDPTVWLSLAVWSWCTGHILFLRWSSDPTLPAFSTITGFSTGLIVISYFAGGVHTGSILWLVFVPFISVPLLPRRWAWGTTAYVCLGIGVLFVIDLWNANPWASVDLTDESVWIDSICALTVVISAHVLADYNERIRKRMQRALRRREAQLQDARRIEALGRMAGGVAHDFNNLMTVVASQSALLRLDHPELEDDPAFDAFDSVVEQSNALTSKLMQYLSQHQNDPQLVDLSNALRNMVPEVRNLLGSDIEVRVVIPDEPLRVMVDETQCERAMMALASNSRDAMPEGGTFTMTLDRASRSGVDGAVIRLADTGVGMTPDVIDRAFDPFFTTKSMSRGTGLGLSSVRGTVRQCGGTITVESEPGEGSVFTIWLPLAEQPEEEGSGLDSPNSSPILAVALPAL